MNSYVYLSLHGTLMLGGVPRGVAVSLVCIIFLDLVAAHVWYASVAAGILWLVTLVIYRHDPIFLAAMLRSPYRKLYR